MATAMSELQQQIEEVRREAFAAGYAAAMNAIRELASRSAPDAGATGARQRSDAGRKSRATAPSRRRVRAKLPQGPVDQLLAARRVVPMHKGSRRS
jgi:hypothetical protein